MKSSLLKVALATAVMSLGAGAAFAGNGNGNGNGNGPGGANWTVNPHSPAYDHPYRHGAIPTRESKAAMDKWNQEFYHNGAAFASNQPTASSGQLSYGGGVQNIGVLSGQSKVYLVFYGTQWGTQTTDANGNLKFSNDTAGAAGATQQMFKGIGTNAELWSAELTQWCDGAGVSSGATSCPASGANYIPYQQNVFAGAWYDNTVASPASATGTQLAQEAIKAAAHFGNTAAGSNRYTYYVILSPKGTNPDNYQSPTQGYCAWHDYTGDGYGVTAPGGDFAFSNQPYNIDMGASCGVGFVNSPGTLDGYTMTLGHEWHEMMSDQFPAGGWTNHTGGSLNGQENSDECAWLAPGSAGGAANVAFSTGTFAEQASWSNDTGNCAISHAIVTHGGGTAGTPTANFSFSTNGLTATFTDTSTDAGGTIGAHSWTFGDGATSTAASPSHAYAAAGTYSVSETVKDSVDATRTSTATKSVTVTQPNNVLQNGVGITISDATVNHQQNWTMAVPAGATGLTFTLSGGTGDADMYVKFGSAPTLSSYDCRPYVSGNSESCPIATAQAGTYYVMVNAYAAYSGVTLKGSYSTSTGGTPTANFSFTTSGLTATFTDSSTDSGGTIGTYSWTFGDGGTSTTKSPSHSYAAAGTYSVTETVKDSVNGATSSKTASVTVSAPTCGGTVLCNGVAVALPSVATGGVSSTYTMAVTAGHTVTFAISGGTGDADIYVKAGSAPTTTSYDCRPYTSTTNESCSFTPSVNTTYYINVRAYAAYSGVSLKGTSN